MGQIRYFHSRIVKNWLKGAVIEFVVLDLPKWTESYTAAEKKIVSDYDITFSSEYFD